MRWVLALALAAGCSPVMRGDGGDDEQLVPDASSGGGAAVSVFDPSITRVIVEIDYETNQEPFTGMILGFGDTFEPTLTNIERLFVGTKTLNIPSTLGGMMNVGVINDEELTIADIIALGNIHRSAYNTETSRTYYVLFVSGYFADDTGPKHGVLGVSIGDTIAMFKDVIRSTNVVVAPNVVRYVEQSTLIHELAHSIGLTDNGVPMVAAHKDAPHGPHCNNKDCVMFWQNDGSADASMFVQQRLLTGSSLLFDAPCLADVDALTGGL